MSSFVDLTPPSTPPIEEQVEKSQIPAITCKSSTKQLKETRKIPAKKTFVRNTATQGKDLKHAVIKKNAKTSSVFLKKVQQENAKEGVAEPAKLHSKLTKGRNVSKMKERGTIADPIPKKKVRKQPESKFESDVQLTKACQKGEQVVPKIDNKAHQNAWVLVKDTSDKDTKMIESKDNIDDKSLHNDNNLNGCSPGESQTSENFSNEDIVMDEKFQKISNNEYQNEQSGQIINSTDIKNDSNGDMFMEEKLSKVNVCGLKESLSHENDSDAGADVNDKRDRDIYKLCNNNNDVDMKGTDLCKSANDDGKKIQNRERNAGDGHKSRHRASEDSSKRRSRRYSNDYKNDRRKWKYRSRSPSIEDYSSDERSSNPHRPERYRDSRRHSRDRRNENYRKYSSRDDGVEEDWSHGERDDDGFRNRWKYFRDVEHERKIDFRLGRSNSRDSAKVASTMILIK